MAEGKGHLPARNREIFEKYMFGASTYDLGEQYGLSHQQISNIVNAYKKIVPDEPKEQTVARLIYQLNQVAVGLAPAAVKGDEKAVGSLVKVQKRIADLLGLDAPKKMEIGGRVAHYDLDGVNLEDLE